MTGPLLHCTIARQRTVGHARTNGSLTRSAAGRYSRMAKSPVPRHRLADKTSQKICIVESAAKPQEGMRLKLGPGLPTKPPLVPKLSLGAQNCSRGGIAVTCVVEQQDGTIVQGPSSAPETERICPSPMTGSGRKTVSAPPTCNLAATVGGSTNIEQGLGDAKILQEHAENLDELAVLRDNMMALAMLVAIEQQTGSHPAVVARAQAMLVLLQRGLKVMELAEVSP
mmetsp:Transcript_38308/g.75956  ORF Transcript_38308/g.75956 Transcript_38308/m.75956 type:complete len:226 (-) Transcript_38308:42-719(-)